MTFKFIRRNYVQIFDFTDKYIFKPLEQIFWAKQHCPYKKYLYTSKQIDIKIGCFKISTISGQPLAADMSGVHQEVNTTPLHLRRKVHLIKVNGKKKSVGEREANSTRNPEDNDSFAVGRLAMGKCRRRRRRGPRHCHFLSSP